MRLAIFADVHGNLEALTAVLEEIRRVCPDRVYCLGDVVGYGADPVACIAEIRRCGISIVAGNHDLAACGKLDTGYFNEEAVQAVQWTAEQLRPEDREFLCQAPLVRDDPPLAMAHGSLYNPGEFNYVMSFSEAQKCLEARDCGFAMVAHSHVPFIAIATKGGIKIAAGVEATVPRRARALVNVGAVGQPRDGDPRAAFAMLDTATGRVEIRRVAYDVESAAKKILAAGLPQMNAYRLLLGS